MPFERLIGAFAFLSLIPFIIFYLRRPKPTEQTIPSLMFFMLERGSTKFHSFLRQFMRNLLFLIQLLILGILAFSIMGYFLELSAEKTGKTIIVLDVSASMQTNNNGEARFQQAVKQAEGFLDGRVSLVLAGNLPRIAAENEAPDVVRKILKSIEPLDTTSNIGDAMLVAGDLLQGKGEIIVLSDFLATEGIDPIVAKRAVSQKASVKLFNYANIASNVGIIGLDVTKTTSRVVLKNYDDKNAMVSVQISNSGAIKDEAVIEIGARSLEEFTFDTLPGQSEIRIIANDDFKGDNSAYVSVPGNIKARVLLITNSDSSNIQAALSSARGVTLDIATLPVVNDFDYDIIILHQFDPKLMLPGYYTSIERSVRNGSAFVITAQENMPDIELLPVEYIGVGNLSRNIINITNYFTDGIDFGVNERFIEANLKADANIIVSADGNPMITISSLGVENGVVVYYGILDEYSSFKGSPTYPQFWSRLVNFLTKTEDLDNYHFSTGMAEIIPIQTVNTPSGKIKTDRLLLDKAGFYTYNKRTVAANLLSERESAVSSNPEIFSNEASQVIADGSNLMEKKSFTALMALIAIVLIFCELIYVKFRGDL